LYFLVGRGASPFRLAGRKTVRLSAFRQYRERRVWTMNGSLRVPQDILAEFDQLQPGALAGSAISRRRKKARRASRAVKW